MAKPVVVYWNIGKLGLILLVSLFFIVAPAYYLNFHWFHFHYIIPTLIGCLPFIFLIGCLLKNTKPGDFKSIGKKITDIRYSAWCPFIFTYEPEPACPPSVTIKAFKEKLEPGDILLRRQERYLEGLVLEQTSYFTHAAIYYGKSDAYPDQVIQAVGSGVQAVSLEEFVKCDAIAVLRFNPDLVGDETWKNKPHKISEDSLRY